MKQKRIRYIIICVGLAMTVLTVTLLAAAPGSSENPLVSYEYLTGVFRTKLKSELSTEVKNAVISELNGQTVADTEPSDSDNDSAGNSSDEKITGRYYTDDNGDIVAADGDVFASVYQVVHLTTGEKLEGAGSCEIILRAGIAEVCITDENNRAASVGIGDSTDGSELLHGANVPGKHLLLVPRGDGRGVIVSSADAYFMVRGDFRIVE